MEDLWKELGIEAKVVEIKELGRRKEGERRMALVRLEDMKGKVEVMKKNVALRGRVERVDDDWTWRERAMQWRLERLAWNERRSGRKALVRYGKIWLEEKWWRWDEETEKLVDGKGIVREAKAKRYNTGEREELRERGEEGVGMGK